MAGFDAPYVPGWDCHGLPIERNVDRELGARKREMTIGEVRRTCRDYASRFIDIQRADFKRLGVAGDWEHPYLTMAFGYQATIVRALARFVEQGLVYKGKKPVHWCIVDRTALAEAEVEYEDHTSPSIYVEFPLTAGGSSALAERVPELAGRTLSVLIWTTTPWTIPANLAVAFHPDYVYGAYPAGDTTVIVAEALAGDVARAVKRPLGEPVARFKGDVLEGIRFEHPLYAARVGGRARHLRHARPGHRRRAHCAGPRRGRLQHRRAIRARRRTRRSDRTGASPATWSCSRDNASSRPTRRSRRHWHRGAGSGTARR